MNKDILEVMKTPRIQAEGFEKIKTPSELIEVMLNCVSLIEASPFYKISLFHYHSSGLKQYNYKTLVDLGGCMLATIGKLPYTTFINAGTFALLPNSVLYKLWFIEEVRQFPVRPYWIFPKQKYREGFPTLNQIPEDIIFEKILKKALKKHSPNWGRYDQNTINYFLYVKKQFKKIGI